MNEKEATVADLIDECSEIVRSMKRSHDGYERLVESIDDEGKPMPFFTFHANPDDNDPQHVVTGAEITVDLESLGPEARVQIATPICNSMINNLQKLTHLLTKTSSKIGEVVDSVVMEGSS
jgi:hypothetical protein